MICLSIHGFKSYFILFNFRRADREEERNRKKDKTAIVNVKLQNIMMMLRKCCNHPYLLEYPFNPITKELIIDERLLNCSGKLLMLDKMLEGLKARGHKVDWITYFYYFIH